MLKGDTIRLLVTFKDFNLNVVQPSDAQLTIYDVDENVIETITDLSRDGAKYYYDYVADDSFIFEFRGTYNNKPILVRDNVDVNFLN